MVPVEAVRVHALSRLLVLEMFCRLFATRGNFFVSRGQSVCVTSRPPFLRTQSHKPINCIPLRFPSPCPANQRRVAIFQGIGGVFSLSLFLFFRVQFRYSKKSTRDFCLTACGQPLFKQPPVSAALVCECGWSERLKLSEQQ